MTTIADHRRPVAPNRLARRFDVDMPNRLWGADITAIWTVRGWLYLAAVLDLADRQVVGWAMADHMRTELVAKPLNMALGRRRPRAELLHHSDRGSQYAAGDYQAPFQRYGSIDEPQRQLLGQRSDGTLLRHVKKRMDRQPALNRYDDKADPQ